MKELWFQATYFFSQIWADMWPVKAPLSLAVGFYSDYLGGDRGLLLIFSVMIAVDMFFGSWLAIKLRRFDVRLFGRWVVKVLTHFTIIGVVGATIRSILGPLSLNFPLLDLFLGLLICTEALSILKNMRRLGLPVPKLAAKILTNVQTRAEQKVDNFFNRPENDRRKRPRSDPCPEPTGKAYDDAE